MIKVRPVLGDHHPERVRLVQCNEGLGNPDPFRQFPEVRFGIASVLPTIPLGTTAYTFCISFSG